MLSRERLVKAFLYIFGVLFLASIIVTFYQLWSYNNIATTRLSFIIIVIGFVVIGISLLILSILIKLMEKIKEKNLTDLELHHDEVIYLQNKFFERALVTYDFDERTDEEEY